MYVKTDFLAYFGWSKDAQYRYFDQPFIAERCVGTIQRAWIRHVMIQIDNSYRNHHGKEKNQKSRNPQLQIGVDFWKQEWKTCLV